MLPSEGKLYGLVLDEVNKIKNPLEYFAEHGRRATFARILEGQKPFSDRPYAESAITRELANVLETLKPDS